MACKCNDTASVQYSGIGIMSNANNEVGIGGAVGVAPLPIVKSEPIAIVNPWVAPVQLPKSVQDQCCGPVNNAEVVSFQPIGNNLKELDFKYERPKISNGNIAQFEQYV
jgi:hypothetical protein